MSLYDRTRCRVRDCTRTRLPDAQVCDADLLELWHNRLARQSDGTYLRRRTLPARDESGWRLAA